MLKLSLRYSRIDFAKLFVFLSFVDSNFNELKIYEQTISNVYYYLQ